MDNDYYDYSSDEEVIEFRRQNDEARRARERARQRILNEDSEDNVDHVRQLARDATTKVNDEYANAKTKSKEQDRKTMEYIDQLLNQTTLSYGKQRKSTFPLMSRYHSDGPRRPDFNDPYDADVYSVNSERRSNGHYNESRAENKPSETASQRVRRIEAKLDGILDYELPGADNFKNMRHSLRDINDKMSAHKLLLDRRSNRAIADEETEGVQDRIDAKYRELEERMPCLSGTERSRNKERNIRFEPSFVPGYATGLSVTNSGQSAELRGRIRTLLCRTRRTAGSEDSHTSAARRRREAAN